MKKTKLVIVSSVVFLLGFFLSPQINLAQAQDNESEYFMPVPADIGEEDVSGEGRYLGWIRGRHRNWCREKMLKLKEEDPEKFEELAGKRREKVKQHLEQLKREDPQRYQRLMQRICQRRRRYMWRLKQESPEKFEELKEARKKRFQQRLEKLKDEDPEKYEKISKRIEETKEFHRLRKENRQKVKEYLEEHPDLKRRLQYRYKQLHRQFPQHLYHNKHYKTRSGIHWGRGRQR